MDRVPQLRTPGIIANELGISVDRVVYLLRKRKVKPIGRAGILRLFDQGAVDTVREALAQMRGQEVAHG